MPTRPWVRWIAFASRSRRQVAAATLSASLTLPVALLGMLATPGCRTESSSARFPSLNAMRWFSREEAEIADDGVELQRVPDEDTENGAETPPLPPSSVNADAFSPPAPPTPEPFGPEDTDGFYGVRPTGAESVGPREPSWANRFRNLFRRETQPAPRKVSVRTAEAVERPPVPPATRTSRPAAVTLGPPEFDTTGEQLPAAPTVERVSRVEPVRTIAEGPCDPLPVIVPGRGMSSRPLMVPATATISVSAEPTAWPHTVAEPMARVPAPLPVVEAEPQPLTPEPAAPLVVPQAEEEMSGPALLQ